MDKIKGASGRIRKEVLEKKFGTAKLIDEIGDGIERVLREEFNDYHPRAPAFKRQHPPRETRAEPKPRVEIESDEPKLVSGDIYSSAGYYFIGGADSPVTIQRGTKLASALEFLLQNVDKQIPESDLSRVLVWQRVDAGILDLTRRIYFGSFYFSLDKTAPSPMPKSRPSGKVFYTLRRISIFAKENGENPVFPVLRREGDLSFGGEYFYVGSAQRGVYGSILSGEGRVLDLLLENKERWVSGIHLYDKTRCGPISAIIYTLKKKINDYSSKFKLEERGTDVRITARVNP